MKSFFKRLLGSERKPQPAPPEPPLALALTIPVAAPARVESPPPSAAKPLYYHHVETLTRYRKLIIKGFAGAPTAAEIEAIEQKLGTRLPADYLDFLQVANGGSTDFSARVPPPHGEPILLAVVFSTHADAQCNYSYDTILGEIDTAREIWQIPPQVLPFGSEGAECEFFLDLTPEGNGRVVVYLAGLPAWTGRKSSDAFVPMANSFTEFIDSLSMDVEQILDALADARAAQDEPYAAVLEEVLASSLPGWWEDPGRSAEVALELVAILRDPAATWKSRLPASAAAIQALLVESGVELPGAYLLLLGVSNGGEGELAVEPGWFQLWQAEEVLARNADYQVAQHAPGFFAFGSSGGGELLALDMRGNKPWQVVMIPVIPMAASEAVVIAQDCEGFLAEMARR